MKEEKDQRQKMVVFDECNVKGAQIDRLTSMVGRMSTQQGTQNHYNLEYTRIEDGFQ